MNLRKKKSRVLYLDLIDRCVAGESAELCTFLSYLEDGGTIKRARKIVILRHDVDNDMDMAVKMAAFERYEGIRSTYFLLHTASYFDYSDRFLDKCHKIQDNGHDLGLHNDVLTVVFSKGGSIKSIIKPPLDFLRSNGRVIKGTSAHGVMACYTKGYHNYEMWKEFDFKRNEGKMGENLALVKKSRSLKDFGFEYEAAFVEYDFYLDDSGGSWNGMVGNGSRLYGKSLKHSKKNIGLKVLDRWEKAQEGVLQMLLHPCWWKKVR